MLTIKSSKEITIKNTGGVSASVSTRIVIPDDVKAYLVLAGVNIPSSANSALTLTPKLDTAYKKTYGSTTYYEGGGAYCHIVLADGTTNTLQSSHIYYCAIRAGESTTLVTGMSFPGERSITGRK